MRAGFSRAGRAVSLRRPTPVAQLYTSHPQIGEFLRFFDVKRDLYVAEVEHVIKDVKEAR